MRRLRYFKITWQANGREQVHVCEHNNPDHVRRKLIALVNKKAELIELEFAKVEEIKLDEYQAILALARFRAA